MTYLYEGVRKAVIIVFMDAMGKFIMIFKLNFVECRHSSSRPDLGRSVTLLSTKVIHKFCDLTILIAIFLEITKFQYFKKPICFLSTKLY